MLTRASVGVLTLSTVGLVAAPAAAQNEAALKAYFEGHRVAVRIDMPGSQDGIDVRVDGRRPPIDLGDYRDNLKKFGTALRVGDSAMVTLVKVKKDLIEFQLDGGGYGTFGDDTNTSVYMPPIEKSEREKELERKIRDEDDRDRRRAMERELDELRDRRERENRRIAMERERAEAQKAAVIADRRLHGGSRFNLRYEDRVPAGVRPEDVMAALVEYVDFGGGTRIDAPPPPAPPPPPPSGESMVLRKGMSGAEAERVFGRPIASSQHTAGDMTVTTLVFVTDTERITADFVEDLLVRYTISSK